MAASALLVSTVERGSRLSAVEMGHMPSFPARIHILLARDSPSAVVIRRGPSKSVCTMLWNRRTDKFTLVQWMRGRVYERRADLSPDGLYFILRNGWSTGGP